MIIVTERCFLYAFQDEPIKDPKPLEIMHLELCRLKSTHKISHRSTLHIRLVKIYSNRNTAQEL